MTKLRKARAIAKACGITFCRGDLPEIAMPPGNCIEFPFGDWENVRHMVSSAAALRKSKQRKGRGR